MLALGEVTMQMHNIRDTRPVLLNGLKLSCEFAYARLVIASMSHKPPVMRGSIIWPSHVSNQRQCLVRPND